MRGELTHVVGHLLGTAHCALCNITHSPIRRQPAWDATVTRLGVPFTLLHRNEMTADIAEVAAGHNLAIVLAKADGPWVQALSANDLEGVGGDVVGLEALLHERIGPA